MFEFVQPNVSFVCNITRHNVPTENMGYSTGSIQKHKAVVTAHIVTERITIQKNFTFDNVASVSAAEEAGASALKRMAAIYCDVIKAGSQPTIVTTISTQDGISAVKVVYSVRNNDCPDIIVMSKGGLDTIEAENDAVADISSLLAYLRDKWNPKQSS